MNTYVRIENGHVVEELHAETLPEMHPSLIWINVTGMAPIPTIGWSYDGTVFSPPPGPSAADLLALVAAQRWQAETSGTTWNGWLIPTDERSQQKYTYETLAFQIGAWAGTIPWKFPHGFEQLTGAQVVDMATAARAHILGCFSLEDDFVKRIGNGDSVTEAEIYAAFSDVAPYDIDDKF